MQNLHSEASGLLEIWVGGGIFVFLENKSAYHMNTKLKELYDTPSTMVLEVKTESCLLQTSDYNYGNLDEPNGVMSLMGGDELIF